MKRLVIYHENCNDGFCAAWLFWKAYSDVVFKPCPNLRPKLEDVVGDETYDEVYILDYSFPRDEMELLSTKTNLLVLDHHKSAEKDCVGLDFCSFDMNRSGAMLAFDYLSTLGWPLDYLIDSVKEFVSYIQDRDLWTKALNKSDDVTAAINSYPRDFYVWNNFDINILKTEGSVINRYRQQLIQQHVERAKIERFEGHDVYVTNCSTKDICSEVGEILAKDKPFAITFFDYGSKREYSLRSREGGEDVSLIAKKLGGGGHKQAAGFTVDLLEEVSL
jgi:oligoribonuclease NrnB/cAMP/cGMP phosphodiesterase (DHH superfamily)